MHNIIKEGNREEKCWLPFWNNSLKRTILAPINLMLILMGTSCLVYQNQSTMKN